LRFAPSGQVKSTATNARVPSNQLITFSNSDNTVSASVTVAPYGTIRVAN